MLAKIVKHSVQVGRLIILGRQWRFSSWRKTCKRRTFEFKVQRAFVIGLLADRHAAKRIDAVAAFFPRSRHILDCLSDRTRSSNLQQPSGCEDRTYPRPSDTCVIHCRSPQRWTSEENGIVTTAARFAKFRLMLSSGCPGAEFLTGKVGDVRPGAAGSRSMDDRRKKQLRGGLRYARRQGMLLGCISGTRFGGTTKGVRCEGCSFHSIQGASDEVPRVGWADRLVDCDQQFRHEGR